MSREFVRWLARRIAILTVVAVILGVLFGEGAVVITVGVGWVIALLNMRLSLPPRELPPVPRVPPDPLSEWPSLDHVASELAWARTSQRHYDLGARKLLQRAAAARLDQRAGIDLWTARDRARAENLIGPRLWPLIDPARPVSSDSHSRGLRGQQVDALLDRLETL
ncbi:MAG: hypothetical protein ACR2KJ_01790 [Jatrophihabitans sp.]